MRNQMRYSLNQQETFLKSRGKLLALTFDDGPNTSITPLILDQLEKYNVPATFFVIGTNLNEEVVPVIQRQLELGCELANHSWTHPVMSEMSTAEIKDEIERTNLALNKLTGANPKLFRPPYIAVSERMFQNIELPFLAGLGCNDWDASVDVPTRIETMLNNAKDGDIFLLHDMEGNAATALLLDTIIPELQSQGYTFVTASELFRLAGVNPNAENHVWYNVYEKSEADSINE